MMCLWRIGCYWLWVCCFWFTASLAIAQAAGAIDSDGDGLPDVWETTVYRTDPLRVDSDGDRYNDREEIANGYNPLGPGRLSDMDYDKDGLNDRLELLFGADPIVPDTDGDGRMDGAEVVAAHSPTSSDPRPLQKTIHINLKKQMIEPRVANIAIASYPISAGLPRTPTPVGSFKVLNKNPRAWSKSAKLWMPYWMHFSGRGHGMHELPEWPNGKKEGANHLGKPASHGCVRMGVGTAKKIYDWAPLGTPVIVAKR